MKSLAPRSTLVIAVFAGTLINLLQDVLGISSRFQFAYLTVLFLLDTALSGRCW